MEKRKKWQFFLILTVITLTVYNILPTIFYYLKPLKSPISEVQADKISKTIEKRSANLKKESKDWIESFCKLIHIRPQQIIEDGSNWIVQFNKSADAKRFRRHLPKAGSLIPFVPAQLKAASENDNVKEVIVQRKIPLSLKQEFFTYAKKGSELHREIIIDRASQIAFALTGPNESALALSQLNENMLEPLAFQINSIADMQKHSKTVSNRFAKCFSRGLLENSSKTIQNLIQAFDRLRDESKKNPELEKKQALFTKARNHLKNHQSLFSNNESAWSIEEIKNQLASSNHLKIKTRNPLFSDLVIDWENETIALFLHPDVDQTNLKQALINEAAKITRLSNEKLEVREQGYSISFQDLNDFSGLIAVDLEKIGQVQADEILVKLQTNWNPEHPDLKSIQIVDHSTFESLSTEDQALSLTVYPPMQGNPKVKVVLSGIEHIVQAHLELPYSDETQLLNQDFQNLTKLLERHGFQAYRGMNQELIFEKYDTFHSLFQATREDFKIKGTQRFAFLELSNLEQRILTDNKIDNQTHEDLIRWKDDYNAAQVSIHPGSKFDVPAPTKNVFLSNLALSWTKYFRGDDQRVIKWGLDLSGGKTVQIELKDVNNQTVRNEEDLKQGMSELYNRVNKMGVSEVAIRQLGDHIVLDFPGSQSLSAQDLIKASTMHFHVVNEKFSSHTSPFVAAAQRFLQEVWNEALITNQLDAESINRISYEHLNSDHPSDAAHELRQNGLILQDPKNSLQSFEVNDHISKIAMIRGEPREWFGQNHPLLFIFANHTLEGSNLSSVSPGYDPQKGNFLSFEVSSTVLLPNGEKTNPRTHLKNWTSRFSKDRIIGTDLEEYVGQRGYRMAVVLNDSVISAPTLNEVIHHSATISGNFSQREVNKLVSDLKAGSLSFTPHILSEKNVSAELGAKDRQQGIFATVMAMLLVMIAMIAYYRFAGLVASIAVLFNLLILWATLQNIGATLSLAGIAGIILTVGMAVDANVLVFERIKEEFALSKKLSSAIAIGYKKAYSAIVDSNVTTIIAALILLNFDAGPIKGFAITLIIGIVSSMFTALFMTRYYFTGWVKNPKRKVLNMAHWIQGGSIDFLKWTKTAFSIAALIIAIGSYLVYSQRSSIFGMDFTGGYSLHVELESKNQSLTNVEDAFSQAGAAISDFQVRDLGNGSLRILFGTSMEQEGKPFYHFGLTDGNGENPRILWAINALQAAGISLTENSLEQIESNWTSMSAQMSDSMRNNALIGLLISFICIFIYISLRFEYKFAAAALICLMHDVFITIGFVGILFAFGIPVQIDLNTVAALMTIVGYSLNDTIIIFDRIREENRLSSAPLHDVVNTALNGTLSRTSITSGTTLLVLIALVFLGGASIFSFALVMTIGVIFGTISSWFIASPLMLFFHRKEENRLVEKKSSNI